MKLFEQALSEQTSRISVIEENNCIIGFCKIDIAEENGKLDYLIVLDKYRKKGYGKKFMDWAMHIFDESNIRFVEVRL